MWCFSLGKLTSLQSILSFMIMASCGHHLPFNTFLNAIQIFIFLIQYLTNNKNMIFERKWFFLHLLWTFEKFGQPCSKPCYEGLFHKTIPSRCPPCHYVNKNSTTVAYKLICYFWSKGILFVYDLLAMAGLKPTTLPICILFFWILNTPQKLEARGSMAIITWTDPLK